MTNPWFKKDISDSQLDEHMRPHVEEMMRHVVRREDLLPQANAATPQQAPSYPNELVEYLLRIRDNPRETNASMRDLSNFNNTQHNNIKRKAMKLGLMVQLSINAGTQTAGIVKVPILTREGYKLLEEHHPNKNVNPFVPPKDNGFIKHRWLQYNICRELKLMDRKAEIEQSRDGKCVDVGVEFNGTTTAYEIELTLQNVIRNVTADLNSYDNVIIVTEKSIGIKNIKKKLDEYLSDELRKRVKVILISSFGFADELAQKGS